MMASNSEPLTEGTVIMADKQYAGRGQQDSIWLAEPEKNLTISIYLAPKFLPLDMQFFLNMAVSNAVSNCLIEVLGEGVKIKWPNDIYYNDKKMGGILIENIVSAGRLKASVIGIGLNVNQQSFADPIKNVASSISLILQEDVNLIKLLEEVCSHIEGQYLFLKAGMFDELKASYLNNLYRFGRQERYRQNGEEISGTIVDVMDSGQLKMEINGAIFQYNFKEVEFLISN
jgi:BirA family biotin operon repressor/biotin-[acetyl-CoA-carboxylase] ligase